MTAEAEPQPVHWEISRDRPDDSIVMTLEEFAEQVGIVEHAFSEYWRLSEKYKGFAKLGRQS